MRKKLSSIARVLSKKQLDLKNLSSKITKEINFLISFIFSRFSRRSNSSILNNLLLNIFCFCFLRKYLCFCKRFSLTCYIQINLIVAFCTIFVSNFFCFNFVIAQSIISKFIIKIANIYFFLIYIYFAQFFDNNSKQYFS